MPDRADAEEHLRVIRSLMERATRYRAISAQGALVGGLLSVAAGVWMYLRATTHPDCVRCTLWVWGLVLGFTSIADLTMLWRDQRRRGEPILSSRCIWAAKALSPALLLAAAATWPVANETLFGLGVLWSGSYGVALLAAGHFAPPALPRLGRAFFAATLLALLAPYALPLSLLPADAASFELYMAATFGLFHLVYAFCTWPRGVVDPDHV